MASRFMRAAALTLAAALGTASPALAANHAKHAKPARHHHAAAHKKKARKKKTVARGKAHPQPTGKVQPRQGETLPTHGGNVTSLNWSGYAVTPGSGITNVASTFVVPSAGVVPPGFAATWTGIGGYSTSDLIQAGVAEQSLPDNPLSGPQYYPWYELLPAGSVQLTDCKGDANCTVTPGEIVSVTIAETSHNNWQISMTDQGHWTWQGSFSYASSGSSAEWILEAPTVGAQTVLANVGTAHFGPTSTYVQNGTTRTIAQGNPTEISLSPLPSAGVFDEATPSPLAADGQSFDVCAYQNSCA